MPTNPPLVSRRKVLGAAIETTAGTPATVSAALSGTIVYDAKLKPQDFFSDGERMPQGHYSGTVDSVLGPQPGKLTFRTELLHGDSLLTLLQGCGFTVSGQTATPSSDYSAKKTLTFKLWEDGRVKSIAGAAGTVTIEADNAQRLFANWDFDGVWQPVADEAMPAFSPITTSGYRAAAATLTLAGSAIPQTPGFSIDLGNEVAPRQSITDAEGFAHFQVEDRKPGMTLDPEARTVANHDAYGLMLAGTAQALSLVVANGAGDTLTIASARAQRLDVDDAERDKKLVDALQLGLHNSSGNDDITFTKSA